MHVFEIIVWQMMVWVKMKNLDNFSVKNVGKIFFFFINLYQQYSELFKFLINREKYLFCFEFTFNWITNIYFFTMFFFSFIIYHEIQNIFRNINEVPIISNIPYENNLKFAPICTSNRITIVERIIL